MDGPEGPAPLGRPKLSELFQSHRLENLLVMGLDYGIPFSDAKIDADDTAKWARSRSHVDQLRESVYDSGGIMPELNRHAYGFFPRLRVGFAGQNP